MPTWKVILLFGLALLIATGVGEVVRGWWSQPPIDAASVSRPTSVSVSSGPAYDATASAALVELAHAVSTSVAPTATSLPPTPTYAVATEIPPVICGPWATLNRPCEMPPALAPTSTPLPDCPVAPRFECIWRGSLGSPVVPTPVVNQGTPWSPS
jgi:hypothetical protein